MTAYFKHTKQHQPCFVLVPIRSCDSCKRVPTSGTRRVLFDRKRTRAWHRYAGPLLQSVAGVVDLHTCSPSGATGDSLNWRASWRSSCLANSNSTHVTTCVWVIHWPRQTRGPSCDRAVFVSQAVLPQWSTNITTPSPLEPWYVR